MPNFIYFLPAKKQCCMKKISLMMLSFQLLKIKMQHPTNSIFKMILKTQADAGYDIAKDVSKKNRMDLESSINS